MCVRVRARGRGVSRIEKERRRGSVCASRTRNSKACTDFDDGGLGLCVSKCLFVRVCVCACISESVWLCVWVYVGVRKNRTRNSKTRADFDDDGLSLCV